MNLKPYKVLKSFQIGCGTHTRNPNPKYYITFNVGDIAYYEGKAPNGYVWFYSEIPKDVFDDRNRGFIDMGCINNMVKSRYVEEVLC